MHKRVLVFGTFDGLHPGHVFFLRGAGAKGDSLVVGVARDAHVRKLKGRAPQVVEKKRLDAVRAQACVEDARLCDEELGSFSILGEVQPDLIVIGHDQKKLEQALIDWMARTDNYIPMTRIGKL